MTDDPRQVAYVLKRAAVTADPRLPLTASRPVRCVGLPAMDAPPRIFYRREDEAAVRAQMAAAGFEFADEPGGAFY